MYDPCEVDPLSIEQYIEIVNPCRDVTLQRAAPFDTGEFHADASSIENPPPPYDLVGYIQPIYGEHHEQFGLEGGTCP